MVSDHICFSHEKSNLFSKKIYLQVVPYPVDWQIKEKEISFLSYDLRLSFRYWDIILHELAGILYYKIKIK